jgi:acetyl-CoA decarbonylase/synthase complex subunit beta
VAGEWENINATAKKLTNGKVERLRLHSVSEAPPTSCGCFGTIAFEIPTIGGIGLMSRRYDGVAPGDLTSYTLANRAGGKQYPGVVGFCRNYLESPRAFAGDGGLSAVKWVTKDLLKFLQPHLPEGAHVATEEDATTVEELKAFLGAARGQVTSRS